MIPIPCTRSAEFDGPRRHRFSLTRSYPGRDDTYYVVGCNPSVADEVSDDHTIRKVVSMLDLENRGGVLVMLNLSPMVMTNLKAHTWSVDVDAWKRNDEELLSALQVKKALPCRGITIIAAWGQLGSSTFPDEEERFLRAAGSMQVELLCWGTTKDGAPRHPLYLRGDTELVPMPSEEATP